MIIKNIRRFGRIRLAAQLFLIALSFLLSVGCALPQLPPENTNTDSIEKYEEAKLSVPRIFRFLEYKKKLDPPLENAPFVEVTKQSMFSKACGVCVIHSLGKYFQSNWKFKTIKKKVLGSHRQGTSVNAIVDWFRDKGYSKVVLHHGDRNPDSFREELRAGGMIIALIYTFRDGLGPNHFVIVSHSNKTHFNIVDSRIGSYSVPVTTFCSRRVLVQGTWISIRR